VVVLKYHEVFENSYTRKIGFLCRLINLLEDLLEESGCRDILVDYSEDSTSIVKVEGIDCTYSILESLELYGGKYDINASIGLGRFKLSDLYGRILEYYKRGFHSRLLSYAVLTDETGIEYYLGVLFDGKGFLLEGGVNSVSIPRIPQCLTAHTHPSHSPLPSSRDFSAIRDLFTNGGLAHFIVTINKSIAIYRAGPITTSDYELLINAERFSSPMEALMNLARGSRVKVCFI
jgi:hypothetical protein